MWWPYYYYYLINHRGVTFSVFLSVPPSDDVEVVAVEVGRMLRLAEQCLERVKSFIGKRADLSASSPGQSEPNQTAVLTDTTANPGECIIQSGPFFYYHTVQSLLTKSLPQRSQIKISQCVCTWFVSKPITTLCLSVSLLQSQPPHLILLLTQGIKQPPRQRRVTTGCCQMEPGSSPLFCLLKSSRDYKQCSHRT